MQTYIPYIPLWGFNTAWPWQPEELLPQPRGALIPLSLAGRGDGFPVPGPLEVDSSIGVLEVEVGVEGSSGDSFSILDGSAGVDGLPSSTSTSGFSSALLLLPAYPRLQVYHQCPTSHCGPPCPLAHPPPSCPTTWKSSLHLGTPTFLVAGRWISDCC